MKQNRTYYNKDAQARAITLPSALPMLRILTLLSLAAVTYMTTAQNAHSEEMLPIPAMPTLPGYDDNALSDSNDGDIKEGTEFIDSFFSSAPPLDEKEQANTEDTTPQDVKIEEIKEDGDKKKTTKKMRSRYVHNFKTQHLPANIYRTSYNKDNRHLPIAISTQDLQSAMFMAAARGDLPAMRALRFRSVGLTIRNEASEPLLIHAVRHGQTQVAHWLLTQGVPLNQVNDSDGHTALHFAAQLGDSDMIETLLGHGANPNVPNIHGVTPIALAEQLNKPELAMMMYRHATHS